MNYARVQRIQGDKILLALWRYSDSCTLNLRTSKVYYTSSKIHDMTKKLTNYLTFFYFCKLSLADKFKVIKRFYYIKNKNAFISK